jgi:hypothetical protein
MREISWKTEIATNILSALEAIDSLGRDLVALLDGVVRRERGQEEVFAVTTLVSVLDELVILRNSLAAMLRVLTAFRLSVSAEEVKAEEWRGVDWERHILDRPDWSAVNSLIPFPSEVESIKRELRKVDESFAERFRFGVAERIATIAMIVGKKLIEHRLSEMASEHYEGERDIERVKESVLLYLDKFRETLETILIGVMPDEKVGGARQYFREIVKDLEGAVREGSTTLFVEKMREIENFAGAVANLEADKERRNLIESMMEELKKKVSGLAVMIWQSTVGMLTKFRLLRECFLRRI